MNSDVPRELMVDLINAHAEHHLGTFALELVHQLRAGFDNGLRTAHFDGAGSLSRTDKAQVKHVAHRRNHVRRLLRCRVCWKNEGPQRHAIELPVIFRRVGSQQKLVGIQGDPHRFADPADES